MAPKLRKANSAQDGHSRGEEEVYYTMFNRGGGVLNEDGSKMVQIGWHYLGSACSPKMDAANVKTNCLSLQKKLSVEKVVDHNSVLRIGTTYRVFTYQQVLDRRRAAGLTHFTNNRGRVELVNPNCVAFGDTSGQSAPGGNLPTVGNLPIAPVGNLPIASCGQSAHPYKKKESKEGDSAGSRVPVSMDHVAEIPEGTQSVAASQEPPTVKPITEPAIAKSALVDSALTTSKEDSATACPVAMPTSEGEPRDTGSHYELQMVSAREDSDEDEAAWREAAEAGDPTAQGPYCHTPVPVTAAEEVMPALASPEPVAPLKPVMPAGLSLDGKVRWCVSVGLNHPFAIAEAIGEHQGAVTQSLGKQTLLHVLEQFEERYQIRWRLAA